MATFWGWLTGVVLILLLSSLLDAVGIEHLQFYIGLGMGAGVGFTQWLFLRKILSMGAGWILASVLGMGLPFLALDLLLPETFAYKLPLCLAIGGITTGLFQSILLKNYFTNVTIWIVGSFIGWTLPALAVLIMDYDMTLKVAGIIKFLVAIINFLIIIFGGIILGLITGATFKRLKKRED